MRRILLSLICVLSALKGLSQEAINAQIPVLGVSKAQAELVHEHLKRFPEGTQVALALIDGQQTIFYGVERRNDSLITINNSDALFEIGSITKVFTAILLAQELVSGRLSPDEKVSGLLDMTFHTGNDMTLQEIASHTSGMPRLSGDFFEHVSDESNPYKEYDPEKLTAYLAEKLQVLEKKEYAYSNTGFAVLGYALSKHFERPYSEVIQNRILDPLQMRNSVIGAEHAGAKLVQGRNPMGEPTSNWDMNVHAPAGGIISSVAEMELFVRAQFDAKRKAMTLARVPIQNINEGLDVCLGWHMRKKEIWNWYSHSGGTGGYRSVLVVDVDNQKGLILLSNISAFHFQHQKLDQLGAKLLEGMY